MKEENIIALYKYIIEYSNNTRISNYFDFLCIMGSHYSKNLNELKLLIDLTLKRILNNITQGTNIKNFDKVVELNMGKYESQKAYELTTLLINEYRKNKFIMTNKECTVFDVMGNIIKENIKSPDPKMYHFMLAYLFRLHYWFYTKKQI